ncbi:hypothetical protein I6E11_09570 [Bacteroides caecigallinarum]|uniref:LamG domain-containing protein n=1 Tax=Bacteroides caecigallinarum TaxID=1411144 RepID=UPI001F3F5777|nr:LamG domain-containing protein [Bacteroides caecigallinarum]MCF2594026.1 hypothetical protein [Bacteroides caecigallinarum]
MIHTNRFIALSCVVASVFATSCVNEIEEGLTSVSGEGYYISLTGEVNKGGTESRAHWDINSDGNQTLAFAWDQSQDEMKSFVWSNNSFVGFKDNKNYSATTVTPNAENKKQAQLQITTGLSREYAENDVIWAVSPLAETNISANNKVTFTLPDQFVQTDLNSTEHLKDYVLMSGTGIVGSDKTASISFDVLPAIYRFKVTNNENEVLTVNEVSISGPFCNQAVLEYGKDPVYSVADGSYTIKVATPAEGLEVAAGATAYLYALVFPTNTSTISSNITLSFKGTYGEVSANYTKTAKCNEVYAGKDLVNNTYNDMNVPVSKGSEESQLPIAVYFNNFENTENNGCTIHGDGQYQNEGEVWGDVFQNGSGAQRTHYLQLPTDVLSHSTETQEMTIAFWINAKNADAYEWAPIFTAYADVPKWETKQYQDGTTKEMYLNTFPMFACQSRGVIQINCAGWCDFPDNLNVNNVNTLYHFDNDWFADNQWHYYTVVLTATNAKVYLDGEIKNEWNVTGSGDGNVIAGLFSNGADLKYICLGGNQAWDWEDNDAAFMFDDFAVYNEVLTQEQIKLLISNKTN